MVGAPDGVRRWSRSRCRRGGRFRRTTLGHAQASSDRALLALRVNGADLSPDHGYPARMIVPALPGVHCTKWLSQRHVRPRLRYGAPVWHLAGHALAFAGDRLRAEPPAAADASGRPLAVLVWLIGGAVLHDLVFLPLYSLGDRILRTVGGRAVNHVRVPAAISGVLLLVYFPLILSKAPATYERNTGRPPPDYLARWLAITAGSSRRRPPVGVQGRTICEAASPVTVTPPAGSSTATASGWRTVGHRRST